MSFENPVVVPQKEALDDKWYDRFAEAGSFQDSEQLTGKKKYREDQREKFISGEIENPTLDYPELEKFDFDGKEKKLLELKKEILENETNETVKQVYRWKINEKLADLRLLRATKDGDDRKFSRYSRFIYGSPSEDVYSYTLSRLKSLVADKSQSQLLDVRSAARRISEEILKDFSDKSGIFPPPVSELSVGQEHEREYTADEIKSAFEGALEIFQVQGFSVVVDREGKSKAISVSQEKKKVTIPEDRKMKHQELRARIAHEIGTHAQRRTKGERSRLKLLGLGLDRYLRGEEGISRYLDQQIEGADDYAGLNYHLAISLASGVDGKKRDFRQVFEILRDYNFIMSKKEKDKAKKSAEDSAWNTCVRVFRGSTCKTPGAVLTRDIVYREGNIGIWNLVKNNSDEGRRFSVGKYDPTNPRHIWILEQLGITDADLASLEQNQ